VWLKLIAAGLAAPGCSGRVDHNDGQVFRKDQLPNLRGRDHPCRNRLPTAIAKLPLIGDKVGIFAVHQFIAMGLV
jgi:hypothetical protein